MSCSSMAWWRACTMSRLRSGWCSQRRRQRLPMAVTVVSSTEARVLSLPPDRLVSISRFTRLAASRMMASLLCTVCRLLICGSAVRWVFFTYCSKQPAAMMAAGMSSQPKPDRSRVPNCSVSAVVAASVSNHHGGCLCITMRCPGVAGRASKSLLSSEHNNSAGR